MISEDAIGMAKEWLGKAYRLGDSEVEDPSFTRHNMEVAFVAGSCAERKACAEHYLGIMRAAVAAEREACAVQVGVFAAKWWSIHCATNKHLETTRKAHDDFCSLQVVIRARGKA